MIFAEAVHCLGYGILKGMEVSSQTYVLGIVCQNIVGLVCALTFAFYLKLGISGLLYGYAVGLICLSITNLIIYTKTSWSDVETNQFKKWQQLVKTKYVKDSFKGKFKDKSKNVNHK